MPPLTGFGILLGVVRSHGLRHGLQHITATRLKRPPFGDECTHPWQSIYNSRLVNIKTRLDCKIGGLDKTASEKVQTNSRANFTREIVWTKSLVVEVQPLRRKPPRAAMLLPVP